MALLVTASVVATQADEQAWEEIEDGQHCVIQPNMYTAVRDLVRTKQLKVDLTSLPRHSLPPVSVLVRHMWRLSWQLSYWSSSICCFPPDLPLCGFDPETGMPLQLSEEEVSVWSVADVPACHCKLKKDGKTLCGSRCPCKIKCSPLCGLVFLVCISSLEHSFCVCVLILTCVANHLVCCCRCLGTCFVVGAAHAGEGPSDIEMVEVVE